MNGSLCFFAKKGTNSMSKKFNLNSAKLIVCCLGTIVIYAVMGLQNAKAATDENGGWATFILTGPIGDSQKKGRWHWWLDGQYRYLNTDTGRKQTLIRPAIGYAANDKLKLWAGYAYLRLRRSGQETVNENRLHQDAVWYLKAFNTSAVTLRSRLEQRWVNSSNDVGWRFRQLAILQSPFMSSPNFSLLLSEELFINLNDTEWGERSGFDENRLFLGISYQMNPATSFQIGYQNQLIDNYLATDQMNHLAMLGMIVKF